MLKIALCDDDELQLNLLQELLFEYNSVSPYRVDVYAFASGADLLKAIERNGRYDIYILDIMMPEMDGMELAKHLRENDEIGKIVFLSAETSFVYKAFAVSASGYLIKPIDAEELYELIRTLRTKIEKEKPSYVLIKADHGDRRVEVKNILYVDMVDRIPVYHLADGTDVVGHAKRCKFQEMVSDLLNGYPFVLSSAGVAVNLANVEAIAKGNSEIMLKGGTKLLCSRTMRENFMNRLNDFWNS